MTGTKKRPFMELTSSDTSPEDDSQPSSSTTTNTATTTATSTPGSKKGKGASSSIIGISRSISACKRCRQKKIKCTHDFPKCVGCVKANVECVSVDPATGREISRSYIVHLESKVEQLERKLKGFRSDPNNFVQEEEEDIDDYNTTTMNDSMQMNPSSSSVNHGISYDAPIITPITVMPGSPSSTSNQASSRLPAIVPPDDAPTPSLMTRVSSSTADSGTKAPSSFFGASSGISFAKLMFTAVNFKGSEANSHTTTPIPNSTAATPAQHRRSIVDASVLKKTAENSSSALLPPKQQALNLLSVYFAQSNSQLPIFHREEFLRRYFEPIYGDVPPDCSFASTYTSINRNGLGKTKEEDTWYYQYTKILDEALEKNSDFDAIKVSSSIDVPIEYQIPLYFMNMIFSISSTVTHLQYSGHISDNFKNAAMMYIDTVYSSPDRLESLQSMLVLTLYSLMRPAVPGVWYILGSSLRLCVDLGLHSETSTSAYDAFTVDLRRRLFWCCYSLDRQVCVYLGRPFGIPEESCHVPFPSDLDDALITREELSMADYSTRTSGMPTYKVVSLSMFKIRKLQAEVQSILYDKKEVPRKFNNLNEWYINISERLEIWKASAPKTQRKMNCDFNFEFFNLNYNHTKIILNGLSPNNLTLSLENYRNVAAASKGIIYSYYELYQHKFLNYTWAATHNLFMAGSSYLYSIFNSNEVRQKTTLKEVQTVALYCNAILTSLVDKCEAAHLCRDIFEILVAAVIKIKYTDNIVNSIDFSKTNIIPTPDSIAKSQPGKHLPESLKHLVSSLPDSLQKHEKAKQQQPPQQLQEHKFITPTIPVSTSPISAGTSLMISQPAQIKHESPASSSLMADSEDTDADMFPFEWSTNESDLTRFFQELNRSDSPVSSVKSSSDGYSPVQLQQPNISPELKYQQPTGMIQGGLTTINSNYSGEEYTNNSNSNGYRSINQQYTLPPPNQIANATTGAVYHHPLQQPQFHSSIPSHIAPTPQFQQQPPVQSYNQYAYGSMSQGMNASNGNLRSNSADRKMSKEGQKIYKMIYQVPSESIWDQFFATHVGANDI